MWIGYTDQVQLLSLLLMITIAIGCSFTELLIYIIFFFRLIDGPNSRTGRVEIRHKGVWGTICDDNFGDQEAKVICRMLGLPTQSAQVYNGTTDYSGDGPVWIRLNDDQGCSGHELDIQECKTKNLWKQDLRCKHSEDVAITCERDYEIIDVDPDQRPAEDPGAFANTSDIDGRFNTKNILSNEATFSATDNSTDCGKIRIYEDTIRPYFGDVIPRIRGKLKFTTFLN